MDYQITVPERIYLRELARKQAEYAALPIMAQRRKMWQDMNDGKPGTRPPVVIETWTFNRDFMPEGISKCTTPVAREIEWRLLEATRWHELIGDDRVIPSRFTIGWKTSIDYLGIPIPRETVNDSQGVPTGYHFDHPIRDIRMDLAKLKPAQCSVDRAGTYAWKQFLEDLLGDLLPVEIRTGVFAQMSLTQVVVHLMGMEAFFMAMYDAPDQVHALMSYLRDNALRVMHWAESEGLLRLNNDNQQCCSSSSNFTTLLPGEGYTGAPARLSDMWASSDSQETVGISQEMFHEFCFPYYRDICAPLGLLYFGCCEPADTFWADISKFPHLRKVSISRWCNQKFMADALRGTPIVFSRKPNPNLLGVDVQLNEEAWAKEIRDTLQHTRGVLKEFLVRDVYTLHGNLGKARRAVEIAHAEIDRHG